jgi:2-polyprenyl-6-hydroxyphenyl methylase/3-demethylubiquinone-9 3-methyltransferase
MTSTIDIQEIDKFSQLSKEWWCAEGALKTLHDINPARLSFIQKTFPCMAHKNILDVGCGGGILAEAMAREGGIVTGLDAESKAIEVAKAHAQQSNLSIQYVCSPLELFQSGPFSMITCMEMLEHVKNPEQVIKDCSRLLEPGGILILSTLHRTWKAYLSAILAAEYLLKLLPRQTHDYDKFIRPSELVAMSDRAGLNFLSMSGLSYHPWRRTATLTSDVSVNYLLACQKPIK